MTLIKPWVNKVKHLGNTISNVIDGCQMDVKVKAAKYIDKCNSLGQEFYFAHPETKIKLNSIYNSHFTGSQLWKFGSREQEKFEGTYNRSVKIFFDLPWATHRYFVEPLTGVPHMRRLLVKRYVSFIEKIRKSSKTALGHLLKIVERDVRTTTGSNLRTIMLQAGLNRLEDLKVSNCDFDYNKVGEADVWRLDFVRELVELRNGDLVVPGMNHEDLEVILEYLCTT